MRFEINRGLAMGLGRKLAAAGVLATLAALMFAQSGLAQSPPEFGFYKNYFVTGDYVAEGVGLRGLGDATTGLASGMITISSVPAGADVVAAFLYWQTIEKRSQSDFAGQNGFFNGHAITGTPLGNLNAPVSWSSGGCAGPSNGTTTLRTYRADVRPFLNLVNGSAQGNGAYPVKLADSGSNGGGTPLTEGATLVIVYRVVSPNMPLSAITIYDGSFAPSNSSQSFDLQMQGFYEAAKTTAPVAHITHIVGNGQPNKLEQLKFNGMPISNAPAAFPGALNGSWDNPTFDVSGLVPAGYENPVDTMVIPAKTNSGCVSWGAVIFATTVQDTDGDGLLDVWETNKGYTTFTQPPEFVSLPGADPNKEDIFIQIDYLASHDFITSNGTVGHTHKPKQAALDMVSAAFSAREIQLHFDVSASAIDEDSVKCQDNPGAIPPFYCEFPGEPAIGWKGGLAFLKKQLFQEGAKDSKHYVMFAHELGLATNIWSISGGTLLSIDVSGGTATVTTVSPHGLSSGDRVRVSGAIAPMPAPGQNFVLNNTYPSITVKSSTIFTFPVANVPAGIYNNPGLFVSSGPARSTSGWSDLAGGDTIITLGLWRSDIAADDQVGRVLTQAGTLAHELGHTLGLRHGGGDNANCKSNFQSVMNYLFQVRGLPGYDGVAHVDYSGQSLPGLNEENLDESAGIGIAAIKFRTRWFAPLNFLDNQLNTIGGRAATRRCDGTLITDGAQMVRLEGPLVAGAIDWDNDRNTTGKGLSQDLSFNGQLDMALTGFNDWGNLDLRQIGARRGVFGFSGDVWGTLDDGSGGTLDDGSGGTLDDGSGGTLDDGSGGTLDDGSGGRESDFDQANSTVDPPNGVTGAQVKKSVVLNWSAPGFGRIRTYTIWRANTTNGPISPNNLPVNIGKVTGTPPTTTFTDTNVKTNTTYTYFVTSALGADSGPNNGNQSGPSNFFTITVN